MALPNFEVNFKSDLAKALARVARVSGWDDVNVIEASRILSRYCTSLRKLGRFEHLGKSLQVCRDQSRILRGFCGRFAAILRVHSRPRGRSSKAEPISFVRLLALADGFSLFRPIDEPARFKPVPHGNGTVRPTLIFGKLRKAAHILVADVISARGFANPFDFSRKGAGIHKAAAAIGAAMEGGFSSWFTFDVKDAFPSVRTEHLEFLGLPIEVITNVIFSHTTKITYDKEHSYYMDAYSQEALRLGLPMGSTLSGVVSSVLIGRKLAAIQTPEPTEVINYVDDGAIGSLSLEDARLAKDELTTLFTGDPAGALHLHDGIEIRDASHGMDFLGYNVRLKCDAGSQRYDARPTNRHIARWKIRGAHMLENGARDVNDVRQMMTRAARSFPLWRHVAVSETIENLTAEAVEIYEKARAEGRPV